MTRAGHGILVVLATAAGVSVVSTAVSSRSASSAVDADELTAQLEEVRRIRLAIAETQSALMTR